jgi:signal transduction histidine kinase/CheY-like chemotaxis protein/HPt (histidine-containing phosphotransfer) domain-containing protein
VAWTQSKSWRDWLRALAQGSTYLGLTLVAVIWGTIASSLIADRDQSIANAANTTATLARAFEEYAQRTIKEVDKTLLILRQAHDVNPEAFDLPSFTGNDHFVNDVTLQIALIGRDGYLKSTNLGPQTAPTDLSDREHYRVQRDSDTDELFISKPVLGRTSGKWSIQLTRRLNGPGGAFNGVLVASVDPAYFGRFFGAMAEPLGPKGAVTLIGRDGIVRARGSSSTTVAVGQAIDPAILARMLEQRSGVFTARSSIDGIDRITGFRALQDFPLIVAVSQGLDDVLAGQSEHRRSQLVIGAGLTLVVLIAILVSVWRSMRLDHALAALKASEARASQKSSELEIALGNMSQGIMMIDGRGTVAVLNRRAVELLGLPEHYLTERPSFDEVLEYQWRSGEFGPDGTALPPPLRDFVRHAGATSEVTVYERTRPNGVVLEIRSAPLPNGGIVRTYTDITERTQTAAVLAEARDRAESASRARTAFLAMMSHEIRTPLNGVIGMASLLAATPLDAEQRRYTGTLRDSAEHLLQVIDDVLDFSKLEADRGTVQEVSFDVAQTIDSILAMVSPRAREKGLFLGAAVDTTIPDLMLGDAGALRQVLLNLLGNGVKFTERGAVLLEATVADASDPEDGLLLRFRVSDTGIGIEPANLPLLFREFSQLDGSISRRFGGTGLGLAISKHLVERLGGTILVESEPGRGTVFTFTMPFRRAPGASRRASLAPLAGERWVVVSASAEARRFLAEVVRRMGGIVEAIGPQEVMGRDLAAMKDGVTVLFDESTGPVDATTLARDLRLAPQDGALRLLLLTPLGNHPTAAAERPDLFDAVVPAPFTCRQLCGAAGTARAEAAPVAAPLASPAVPRQRILLAEDNRTNRLVLQALLDRMGYACSTAEDGVAAVCLAQEGGFALVLMDLMMPGMDGFEAARAIRKLPGPAGAVPIVALTADVMTADPAAAAKAGMDGFATKPVTRERLDEVIREAVAARATAPPASTAIDADAIDVGAWELIRDELGEETVDVILATFLEDTEQRLAEMGDPSASADQVGRHAHALKSAAATFGFSGLSAAAEALEASCSELTPAARQAAVAQLEQLFAAGRRAFEARRSAPGHGFPSVPALVA